jgi:lysozyme
MKAPAAAVGVLGLAALIASFLDADEGGRHKQPYLDSAGIPTACTGIIGPEVTRRHRAGESFTDAECDALEQGYVVPMVQRMQACVGDEVLQRIRVGEFVAYGRNSYSTGVGAFCRSPMAALLKQGDHAGACRAMANWRTFTGTPGNRAPRGQGVRTAKGRWLQDCRDPANKCRGLAIRRVSESHMCLAALED